MQGEQCRIPSRAAERLSLQENQAQPVAARRFTKNKIYSSCFEILILHTPVFGSLSWTMNNLHASIVFSTFSCLLALNQAENSSRCERTHTAQHDEKRTVSSPWMECDRWPSHTCFSRSLLSGSSNRSPSTRSSASTLPLNYSFHEPQSLNCRNAKKKTENN